MRKVLQLLSDGKDHAEKEILKHVGWRSGSTFHSWLEKDGKLTGLVEHSGTYGHYMITGAGRETLGQFDMMNVSVTKTSEPIYSTRYDSKYGFLLQVQIPPRWRGGQDKLDVKPLTEKLLERRREEWLELAREVIQLIHFWAFKEDVWGNKIAAHEFLGKRKDLLLLQARPEGLKRLVDTLQTFQK